MICVDHNQFRGNRDINDVRSIASDLEGQLHRLKLMIAAVNVLREEEQAAYEAAEEEFRKEFPVVLLEDADPSDRYEFQIDWNKTRYFTTPDEIYDFSEFDRFVEDEYDSLVEAIADANDRVFDLGPYNI